MQLTLVQGKTRSHGVWEKFLGHRATIPRTSGGTNVTFVCCSAHLPVSKISPSQTWTAGNWLVLFLCLSLVLFFRSAFLSFLFCFLLVPSFSLFLSFSVFFAFVSWKLTTSKDSNAKCFSSILCLFFGFLSCFLFQIPFSYLCFFPGSQLCFCSTSKLLVSKNTSWKTPIFGQKASCNKTGYFLITCVLQNVKSYRFFCCLLFGQIWLMFKKHHKIGISAHFQKQKNDHFERLLSGPSKGIFMLQQTWPR